MYQFVCLGVIPPKVLHQYYIKSPEMVLYFQGYYTASNALIINKNIAHNNKGCNTRSKNFLFFSWQEYYTKSITCSLPRLSPLNHRFLHRSLYLRYAFALGPLYLRFRSVPKNGRKMGLTRDLQGTYIGTTKEA